MGSSHAAELQSVSLASLQQPASSTFMRASEHFAPLQTAPTVTVGSRFLTDEHSTSITTAPVPTNSAIADNTVHTINSAFADTTLTFSMHNTIVSSHFSPNAQIAPAINATTTPDSNTASITTAQTINSSTAATTISPADANTVQPPVTVTASTSSSADTTTLTATVPTVVVKQLQLPKPYTGNSSWKSFKEHFERVARANNWTNNAEKVQQLTLALEGPAADTLKEIDETSSTAYNDIWVSLKSRFGRLDEPREAMRRFENRKQADTESISDFAMQIRLLFHEAWPSASADFKDITLKRRFEDGLLSLEMSQYLRLHARDVDFATTVLKARQFADTTDMAKPKKSVKFVQLDHNWTTTTLPPTHPSIWISSLCWTASSR